MEIKLIELRDRATFIPVMAVRLAYRDSVEKWLLGRAGYASEQTEPHSAEEPYVVVWPLIGGTCTYDPFGWSTRARTYPEAHMWLIKNWNKINSGDVLDVEFILGESERPKESERVR